MKRDLDVALAGEIEKSGLNPFLALRIDTPDPVFAFTGSGTIAFGGHTYTGIEGVASISAIGESTDGSATGVSAALYRVPSEFRDDLADQAVRGCLFELYLGVLDESYTEVLAVKRIWKGTLEGYTIRDAGETLSIEVEGESRAIDQRRPAIKRFSDEYQQRKHPGDRGFEYLAALAEIPILWAEARQDPL